MKLDYSQMTQRQRKELYATRASKVFWTIEIWATLMATTALIVCSNVFRLNGNAFNASIFGVVFVPILVSGAIAMAYYAIASWHEV